MPRRDSQKPARKPQAPSGAEDFTAWKTRAEAALSQLEVNAGKPTWRALFIRGLSPEEAAERVATEARNSALSTGRKRR